MNASCPVAARRRLPVLARAGYALDRALAVFFPGYGKSRVEARDQFNARMYAAARPTEDAGGWMPYDGDPNSLIRGSSAAVRARVRQLVRDFPYASRAQKIRNALIIGNGIRMRARFKNPDGSMNREVNTAMEGEFADWAQKADVSETQTFADLQALADRQLFDCGEYFFIKRYLRGKKNPLRLQPMEADRLPFGHSAEKAAAGNAIEDGIEYQKATGRPMFYHFQDDGFQAKTIRVPADLVIHGYEMTRPGQLRGISPIASAVMVAGNLGDLLSAELEAMRMASRLFAFVRTNDIPGAQKAAGQAGDNGKRKIEYFDHATIQYLRQGDEFTLGKIDRQSGTFEPYIKFNIRTFAIGAGLSYEWVSGDYDKISYSNLRGIRMDLAASLVPVQRFHINRLCRPTGAAWLESAVLTNPSLLPHARRITPAAYTWIAPGMESPDRLKDANANKVEMGNATNSPQRICSANGVVFEEILDELAEARDMAAERGLTLGDVSASAKTNPAALMDDEDPEEDEE